MDETSTADKYWLSLTHLQLKSLRYLLPFLWQTLRVQRQLRATPGCRKVLVRQQADLHFWTMSLWDSKQAMQGFRAQGAHKKAMRSGPRWSRFTQSGGWLVGDDVLPAWAEVDSRLRGLRQNED